MKCHIENVHEEEPLKGPWDKGKLKKLRPKKPTNAVKK